MSNGFDELVRKIEDRSARVAVVGLGYVGLPVAVAFAEAGYDILGVDVDEERANAVQEGESYLEDVDEQALKALIATKRLSATTSYEGLKDADAILICVPTPLKERVPDLSLVVAAGESVAKVLQPGTLVVLESTTYPGSTEELLSPILESSGLRVGEDFLLAFSPERIDPGNPVYSFADIPKVVGGVTQQSTEVAAALYGQVVPEVIALSGAKEAELTKLIENTFRHVNIALVNELAVYAHEMGIDIWEAIEAAATKPFGFITFWPGPGWGGHCIPLDPAYLSWRVRQHRSHEVRFVELAHAINSEMPRYVVERVTLHLNEQKKALNGAKILGIGVAYKGGVHDTRESPGLKVLSLLAARGADVTFHDPLASQVQIDGQRLTSVALTPKTVQDQDIVAVLISQAGVDWELLRNESHLILDCCNAFGRLYENVRRL